MSIFNHHKPDIEAAYKKYADILYRVALAQLANDADAQDAVQDVFIKYMTVAPMFEGSEHERAWFLRVMVNRCHDVKRWSRVRESLPLENALGVAASDNRNVYELFESLSKIPATYRDIIILHCLEGFSQQETAKILGISLSAVKMRLSRARATLQQIRQEESNVQ